MNTNADAFGPNRAQVEKFLTRLSELGEHDWLTVVTRRIAGRSAFGSGQDDFESTLRASALDEAASAAGRAAFDLARAAQSSATTQFHALRAAMAVGVQNSIRT